ncbi:hypothetical protein DXG01_016451 [Tephrocybe rancida]|nr:hypothetical protein DXG01_016451 [Tephrocybe rancida]
MRCFAVAAALIPIVAAETFNILVGQNGELTYTPESVIAKAGDIVNFQFVSKNHTVTQSTFLKPCEPLTTPTVGIDSGFQAVPTDATSFPQYSITIQDGRPRSALCRITDQEYLNVADQTPFWFYCAQAPHCSKGMVFAINPTEAKSYATFKATAMGGTSGSTTNAPTPSGSATNSPNSARILSGNNAAILATLGLVAGLIL